MPELSDVSVILPSLDPDEKLSTVIHGLIAQGFSDIILINDGSKPEKLPLFEQAAALPQVHLLHHEVNRGKGAALKTGFAWFLENRPNAKGVVTVDGDNQHHPEDTAACAIQMVSSKQVVLGCRDFDLPHVPARSRYGNKTTSMIFKVFVGMNISDTQTGLRAIPSRFLPLFLEIKGDRFEYETNMLLAMKVHFVPFSEVKIRTVYIEENKSSHFRAVRDSWRIYKLILSHFFKYTLSSLVSFVADEGLFIGLSYVLHNFVIDPWLTVIPFAVARTISSLLNFFINKQLVFHSKGNTFTAMVRYFALAIPQGLAQLLLTYGTYRLFSIDPEATLLRGAIYAVVMVLLFFFSFIIQQRWVFSPKKQNS